jgi:hypothetical protein
VSKTKNLELRRKSKPIRLVLKLCEEEQQAEATGRKLPRKQQKHDVNVKGKQQNLKPG